jgi:probable phosphoglycerate mutase
MMQLLFVRHGESTWNAERRLQGQADTPLSDEGRRQAVRLAPLLKPLTPNRTECSDLQRARETADILGYPQAVADAAWREIDVGAWAARPLDEIEHAEPGALQRWRAGLLTPPNGESWRDFRSRIERAIAAATAAPAECVLIVAHGGVIRAACEILVKLPPAHLVPVRPASLTIFALDNSAGPAVARLEAFNLASNGLDFDAPD